MNLFEELKAFSKKTLHWIYWTCGLSVFFLSFGLQRVLIHGKSFVLPWFSGDNFAVQIFKIIQHNFLPPGVFIIVTNPVSGFMAQLEIAMMLSLIVILPFFISKVTRYVSPALYDYEKKAIFKSLIFSTILFIFGCIFAYYYMIPLTFKFMYPFATSLGVMPFFSLDSFMSWVICIFMATGVTFLLPVFMIILSSLGIVKHNFWKTKWRQSFLFLLIFSAVITPDQTGFTMVLLFIPLAILYVVGIVLTAKFDQIPVEEQEK